MKEFSRCVRDSRQLAIDTYKWSLPTPPATAALINTKRRDWMTELAFFRTISAWEAFLEESFILYMLGQQAPRGKKAKRYGFPPNEKAAYEWVADGRDYAKWSAEQVKKRSERLFHKGHPFSPVFTAHHNLLFQVKTVRNAIAHDSSDAWDKFEELVRNEIRTVPANTTVGSFLLTIKPRTNPPSTFLEFYFREIEALAQKIIPT